MPETRLPPLIAVVGCDGSGKTTVTQELHSWLSATRPTALCHLGKQSGNIGRAIARLPLVGPRLGKTIRKHAKQASSAKGPSLGAALIVYAFVIRRTLRFRRMQRLRRAGFTIIADRFPQLDTPKTLDGVQLDKAPQSGPIAKLARMERRRFEHMTGTIPDLVIRLNVDLETALQRKPDHEPDTLVRKIASVPILNFKGARIVDIDATRPLREVLSQAQSAITESLERLGQPNSSR